MSKNSYVKKADPQPLRSDPKGKARIERSFVRGLGSLLAIDGRSGRFTGQTASDALRGDWARIGSDMRTVIRREEAKKKL